MTTLVTRGTALAALALAGLTGATAADKPPTTFFVAVLVSECTDAGGMFPPIPKAEEAGRKMVDAVTAGDKNARLFVLTNAKEGLNRPTANGVRENLKLIASEITDNDRLIVLMVSHGFENDQGPVFVPCDAKASDPDTFLCVREVVGRMKAMRGCSKMLIGDFCRDFTHPGLRATVRNEYLDGDEKRRPKNPDAPQCSMVTLFACQDGAYAYQIPQVGPSLTVRLGEALSSPVADADKDGKVSTREAIDFARTTVRKDARTLHLQKQEVADDSSGEPFTLATVGGGKPDAKPSAPADYTPPTPVRPAQPVPFGPPPTPSSPRVEYGLTSTGGGTAQPVSNGRAVNPQPFVNSQPIMGGGPAFGGQQFGGNGTVGGTILNVARGGNPVPQPLRPYVPPVTVAIPRQVMPYIPHAGQSVGVYANQAIRAGLSSIRR